MLQVFLHHFVQAKLATSRIRVKHGLVVVKVIMFAPYPNNLITTNYHEKKENMKSYWQLVPVLLMRK